MLWKEKKQLCKNRLVTIRRKMAAKKEILVVILILVVFTIFNKLNFTKMGAKTKSYSTKKASPIKKTPLQKADVFFTTLLPIITHYTESLKDNMVEVRPGNKQHKMAKNAQAPNANAQPAGEKGAKNLHLIEPILQKNKGKKNTVDDAKLEARRNKKPRNTVLKETTIKQGNDSASDAASNITTAKLMKKRADVRLIEEQKLRQTRMRKFCTYEKFQEHTLLRNYMHMTYSEREHLSYCVLPKVACTNWKKMFLAFNGDKTQDELWKVEKKRWVHQIRFDRIYRLLNEDERTYVRNNFYSFMFSRHPFERLVASFRNKIVEPWNDSYKKRYGSKMLALSRRNMPANEIAKGEGVTFPEFVRYLLVTKPAQFDEHWAIQSRYCQPCLTGYNYYGKMDTLLEDAQMILKENRIDDKYIFFNNQTDKYKEQTKDLVKRYYRQVKRDELLKLYEVYKDDFVAFGYEIDEYLKLTKP